MDDSQPPSPREARQAEQELGPTQPSTSLTNDDSEDDLIVTAVKHRDNRDSDEDAIAHEPGAKKVIVDKMCHKV